MFDYNDPAIAQYLPSYLSQQSYSQAGGTAGGYAPWVSNQIQKGMQNAMYSQYDPRFFQGQTDFTNSYGGHPLDRNTQNAEMFDFQNPELFRQKATTPVSTTPASTPTAGTPGATTTPASSGAATALGAGARSLKNRKPGLAGGFTGWGGDQSGSSNSNFNYFSRFA